MKNRLLLAGALLLSSLGLAASAGANTTCVPFNMYWNECTVTYLDPATGEWMQEIYYQPVQGLYDSIDP
ncbi:MAG TPA: hypothetical protein VFQ84_02245 [Arenimonas sp.]|uniref:hypothetical protein n=1 Tax=Arenimonas sp. TaxID=1872635 RepID=UPI002D7F53A7|nr:hypothetical protein [Arenimonas sp.]HEU0152146.1 hypothetical protein [Arenimonas sp.]